MPTKIYPASRMVSTLTGLVVQRNKAIVGENAFAHESGIHQDGILKYRETYEIMDPATVGIPKSSLVLGKHSGRHAFRDRVVQLGYTLSDEQIEAGVRQIQGAGGQEEGSLRRRHRSAGGRATGIGAPACGNWSGLQVTGGSNTIPTATVTLKRQQRPDDAGCLHRRRPGRCDLLGDSAPHRHSGNRGSQEHSSRQQPRRDETFPGDPTTCGM